MMLMSRETLLNGCILGALLLISAPALAAPCDNLDYNDECTTSGGEAGYCTFDPDAPANNSGGLNSGTPPPLICEQSDCSGKTAGASCVDPDLNAGTCEPEEEPHNSFSNNGSVTARLYCTPPPPCDGKVAGDACTTSSSEMGVCEPAGGSNGVSNGSSNGSANGSSNGASNSSSGGSSDLYCAIDYSTVCDSKAVGDTCFVNSIEGTCAEEVSSSNSANGASNNGTSGGGGDLYCDLGSNAGCDGSSAGDPCNDSDTGQPGTCELVATGGGGNNGSSNAGNATGGTLECILGGANASANNGNSSSGSNNSPGNNMTNNNAGGNSTTGNNATSSNNATTSGNNAGGNNAGGNNNNNNNNAGGNNMAAGNNNAASGNNNAGGMNNSAEGSESSEEGCSTVVSSSGAAPTGGILFALLGLLGLRRRRS